jgi:hypothetical protein
MTSKNWSRDPIFNDEGTSSANVGSDLLHSISWGGITSVTVAVAGKPIEHRNLALDTGFEYSLVFQISEPARHVAIVVLSHRRVGLRGCRIGSVSLLVVVEDWNLIYPPVAR